MNSLLLIAAKEKIKLVKGSRRTGIIAELLSYGSLELRIIQIADVIESMKAKMCVSKLQGCRNLSNIEEIMMLVVER